MQKIFGGLFLCFVGFLHCMRFSEDEIQKKILLWKQYELVVEEKTIPLPLWESQFPEEEYVKNECLVDRHGAIHINQTLRRKEGYWCTAPCWFGAKLIGYKGTFNTFSWKGFIASYCCMCLEVTPDMPLDEEQVWVWNVKNNRWSNSKKRHHKEECFDVKVYGEVFKKEGLKFLETEKFVSLDEPYILGVDPNFTKVVCVCSDQNKLYIVTLEGGVHMDVPEKLHDCCIKFE